MDLKNEELHIWKYSLNTEDYISEKNNPLLSKNEVTRCNQFLQESDKIRYICNHRFVRNVLSLYLNIAASKINFDLEPRGKPFIKNSNLFFNYSYRASHGLLAISKNQAVGVDIEKMKPLQDILTFSEFSFSEQEKEIIFKSENKKNVETLFTFWTFKEAIIKLLGIGLNADLTKIDLSDFFYSELNPLSYSNNEIFTIKKIIVNQEFKAAFALKGNLLKYQEFDFNEHNTIKI